MGKISWEISFYALIAAIFIQIGTNLVNDALDFKKGADTKERLGPVRVTQSGLLRMDQVLAGGMMCFGAALLFSIPLVIAGGWPLAVIMALSVLCGYMYTGGPFPLAYVGLGDLFVLLFFGFVATSAVYCLQGGALGFQPLLAGAQVGLLSTVMIAVNNLRDVASDSKANKRTLPVRFGATFGRWEISMLILLAFILNFFWFAEGYQLAGILPFSALPIGILVIRGVWSNNPGEIYNRFLGLSALLHVLFGILLTIGLFTG
jgi:1,4-dihydroxy-2-naphthoate octaprenyltransferase